MAKAAMVAMAVLCVACGGEQEDLGCSAHTCPHGCCLAGVCHAASPTMCGEGGEQCVDCLTSMPGRADSCASGACLCLAASELCAQGLVCGGEGCAAGCEDECAEGEMGCTGGAAWSCGQHEDGCWYQDSATRPEICDGEDNDCDSLVDEQGVCGTCFAGVDAEHSAIALSGQRCDPGPTPCRECRSYGGELYYCRALVEGEPRWLSEAQDPLPNLWIGPRPFAGKDPATGIKYVRNDYALLWQNPQGWAELRASIKGVILYVESLQPHYRPNIDVAALAGLFRTSAVAVNIEVGGIRLRRDAEGRYSPGHGIGAETAAREWELISAWLDAGGELDMVTLDNGFSWAVDTLFHPDNRHIVDSVLCYDELIDEQVSSMAALREHLPQLRFSVTEFAGFFAVQGAAGTTYDAHDPYQSEYQARCGEELDLSFERWLATFVEKARSQDINVEWLVIDYPPWRVERDGEAAGRAHDMGRILAIEQLARSNGIDPALYLNAYHIDHQEGVACYGDAAWPDPDCVHDPARMVFADEQACERTVRFLDVYLAEGGQITRFVHQSWHPHPHLTGPETAEHTFLHTSAQIMDRLCRGPAPLEICNGFDDNGVQGADEGGVCGYCKSGRAAEHTDVTPLQWCSDAGDCDRCMNHLGQGEPFHYCRGLGGDAFRWMTEQEIHSFCDEPGRCGERAMCDADRSGGAEVVGYCDGCGTWQSTAPSCPVTCH